MIRTLHIGLIHLLLAVAVWHITAGMGRACPSGMAMGGDTIAIGPSETAGVYAEVYYSNALSQRSGDGHRTICWNGVVAHVEVKIGGAEEEFREGLIVTLEDAGLIAFPAEIWIHDGETATIQIMAPLF